MVFDDEMDLKVNEDATSKKSEPQLEKYGVWIKKGPESLDSPQEIPEINDIPDITETSDFSAISEIQDDFTAPQVESIDEEIDSLMDPTPTIEETPAEPQIPVDTGLPEGFDIPGIDLSAFENNDIPTPKPAEPEGEVTIDMDDFFSSDSGDGEIDLSSLFGDGDSIDFDDFMGGDSGVKKEPEIVDQEPLNIQLEFDDNFVLETKADSLSQVEFVGLDGVSGEMSFDDLFDNIQDEGAISASDFDIPGDKPSIPSFDPSAFATEDFTSAFMTDDSPAPQATPVVENKESDSGYDDASEFDDLLSSLDDATPLTETPEEAKTKKLFQDYDITVTMDEEDLSEETEEEDNESEDDWDDISLFQSNEDIENFKQQNKNNGAPVGGMKVLEAQSAMDLDEIDNILDEVGFSFPSDEVKEDVVEEISIDSENEISIEDNISEESKVETVEIEESTIETDMDFVAPQEIMLDESVEEPTNEEAQSISFETELQEPVVEATIEEDNSTNSFESEIEEPVIETSITEEEQTIDFEPEIEEPIVEDAIIEEPNIDLQQDIEEPIIETAIEEEVETLDQSFNSIEETEEDLSVQEESQEVVQTTEDELLDMDFANNSSEEIKEEEIPSENTIEETTTVEETTEEGENMNEINENNNVTSQPDNSANAILEKIAAEICNLRSEISTLRSEFNSFKTTPIEEENNEVDVQPEAEEESTGFFSDDSEDETIALSGDELNNILSNADFTEEETTQEEPATEELNTEETEEVVEEPVDEITEPVVEETTEEEIIETPVEDEITEESLVEPEFEEPVVEESQIEEPVIEDTEVIEEPADEIPSNPLGDATELTDSDLDTMEEYEEDNFAEESETSTFADEDLTEPELNELQMDNNFDETDEDLEEIDIPKDEEVTVESESNDFIDSINEVEPTISETLTEDRLKYLEDLAGDENEVSEDEPADEISEPEVESEVVLEEKEEEITVEDEIVEDSVAEEISEDSQIEEPVIEDTVEEVTEEPEVEAEINEPVIEEIAEETQVEEAVVETEEILDEEDEEAEQNEPTEDVFNSNQWDNEVPTVDNVIAEPVEETTEVTSEENPVETEVIEPVVTEEEMVEPVVEEQVTEEISEKTVTEPEVTQPVVTSSTPVAQPATAKIQDDIKSVLVYMDQLLENLPEDKIEEFARSEHFDTYKKLFSELGISN